jgi:hypothetical protein
MPGMRRSASTDPNGPLRSRSRTIASARRAPMPGRASSSAVLARLSETRPGALACSGWICPAAAATLVKLTWSRMAANREAPTPGTLSNPSRLPNGPRASRSATMRFASPGPTRGSRAISAAPARSRSIRSPGSRGLASAMVLSLWANGDCPGNARTNSSSPGAVPGRLAMSRTPCPATASERRRTSARRSAGGMVRQVCPCRLGEPPSRFCEWVPEIVRRLAGWVGLRSRPRVRAPSRRHRRSERWRR